MPRLRAAPTGRFKVVGSQEATAFDRDGYLRLSRAVVPTADVDDVRARIDLLFAQRDKLPSATVRDLGRSTETEPIPEINWVTRLDPQLLEMRAFANLAAVAADLLGADRVRCLFDHAIYKPPRVGGRTAWHQDIVYDCVSSLSRPVVTVWLALDDVPVDAGCMMFAPGSHRGPLHPHAPHGDGLGMTHVDDSTVVVCPLPKGGCTVHLPRTVHAAGPNLLDRVRPAWIVKFAADDRPWVVRAVSARRREAEQQHQMFQPRP
jgi:hypothetical protein